MVNIHHILYHTTAEGFGERSCIWFQGCSRHCKGCMAQDTWEPEKGKQISLQEILRNVSEAKEKYPKLEGVTFLGGEPFEQPGALCRLTAGVKNMGLSVIVFTGFTLEELRMSEKKDIIDCLANIDLLIDGAYVQEKRDLQRPWTGSSNQRYLFLTDKYSQADVDKQRNRVEVRITPDGKILVNGMADFEAILKSRMREHSE